MSAMSAMKLPVVNKTVRSMAQSRKQQYKSIISKNAEFPQSYKVSLYFIFFALKVDI